MDEVVKLGQAVKDTVMNYADTAQIKIEEKMKVDQNFELEKSLTGFHFIVSVLVVLLYLSDKFKVGLLKKKKMDIIFKIAPFASLLVFLGIGSIMFYNINKEKKQYKKDIYVYHESVINLAGAHLLLSFIVAGAYLPLKEGKKTKYWNKIVSIQTKLRQLIEKNNLMIVFWLISSVVCGYMWKRYNDDTIQEKYVHKDKDHEKSSN